MGTHVALTVILNAKDARLVQNATSVQEQTKLGSDSMLELRVVATGLVIEATE